MTFFKILLVATATMILSQCSSKRMKPEPSPLPEPPPLGAPEGVSSDHKGIQRAKGFALSEKALKSPVEEVSNAKIQMVAGYNYLFDIKLENGTRYHIEVYEDLGGVMSVTSFEQL